MMVFTYSFCAVFVLFLVTMISFFCFVLLFQFFFSVRSFFGKQFSRKERKRRRRWQQPHNVITSFICFFYTLVCYSILLIWTKKQTPHRSPLNCALWLQREKNTHCILYKRNPIFSAVFYATLFMLMYLLCIFYLLFTIFVRMSLLFSLFVFTPHLLNAMQRNSSCTLNKQTKKCSNFTYLPWVAFIEYGKPNAHLKRIGDELMR